MSRSATVTWDQYKEVCDRPDVLSRWLVQQTTAVCDQGLAERLNAVIASNPLEKPPDHKGGPLLDMFRTEFSIEDVVAITRSVSQANKEGVVTTGPVNRSYSGILKAWQEYERMLTE